MVRMTDQELASWENQFQAFLAAQGTEPGHGLDHIQRVVANARQLAAAEDAPLAIVLPAAWLHDCVSLPKNSLSRARASTQAASVAREFLAEAGYPAGLLEEIAHTIAAHSFTAGIPPRTLSARVVQDADRLDALGAIGLARCLAVGTTLGRRLYDPADPFCQRRPPDDGQFTLDHFYAKLLSLPATMQTETGRREAIRRAALLQTFLEELARELAWSPLN